MKKKLIRFLPYLLVGLFATNLSEGWRILEQTDFWDKVIALPEGIATALQNPLPSLHPVDLIFGALFAVGMFTAVYLKSKSAKKYRHGVEHGSARWGNAEDIRPYMDTSPEKNVILTNTEGLTMNNRPKNAKYARNKNILVIGGSGSGKTRFFCKPSLLQCHSSYVVTDPKGTILNEVGRLLEMKKYRIKSLNLINFKKSMKYNPLAYIRSEKDILKLVNALILNTKGARPDRA